MSKDQVIGGAITPDKQLSKSGSAKRKLLVWIKRLVIVLIAVVMLVVVLIGYANLTATWASWGKLFDEVENVPEAKVGLVFGT